MSIIWIRLSRLMSGKLITQILVRQMHTWFTKPFMLDFKRGIILTDHVHIYTEIGMREKSVY